MSKQQAEHVAVIMDGNGRWAEKRGKSRAFGHQQGVEMAREIVRASAESGVSTLTLFAFSTENKQRPRTEVSALVELFTTALHKEIDELVENGICLKFLGDLSFFKRGFQKLIHDAESRTENLDTLRLNVAVNYSGRWDIANAVLNAFESGRLTLGDKTQTIERVLPDYLHTSEVDLLIRTGGECRISNFLLWQSAYAELYFTDVLWPDFNKKEYMLALDWYANRERRFGLTSKQVQHTSEG